MKVFKEKNDKISDENCVICFDKLDEYFSKDKYVLECLQCNKQFHPICIDKWKIGRNNCPYCRYTIRENNSENDMLLYEIEEPYYYYHSEFTIHYNYFPIYLALASLCKILFLFIVIFVIIPIYFIFYS